RLRIASGRRHTRFSRDWSSDVSSSDLQALKSHPAVMDALVAGVPDDRFGERVAAVVELRPDASATAEELRAHCREHLAGYKIPALVRFTEQVVRSPSGKADYRWAKRVLAGDAR